MYRVNWLRAKSRRDCWAQELELLKSELLWTRLFHQHRKEDRKERAQRVEATNPELSYYALKQVKTWSLLESQAHNALAIVNPRAATAS